MVNLIECSVNYSDTSGSLWQFKRDKQSMNNENNIDTNADNSLSFKYKSSFLNHYRLLIMEYLKM